MARRDHQVAVPNFGGNNAFTGLSNSLTDLSKIMLMKGKQEQDQQRWDEQNARLQADHDYKVAGQKAKELFTKNYTDGKFDDVQYTLDDYNGDIRTQVVGLRDRLLKGEDTLRSALTGSDEDFQAHMTTFKNHLTSGGVDPDGAAFADAVFERERRLKALHGDLTSGKYEDEEVKTRVDDLVTSIYGDRRAALTTAITGGQALLANQQKDALLRRVSPEVLQHLDRQYLDDMLGNKVTAPTMEQLTSRHKDNVTAANNSMAANQRTAATLLGKSGSGRSTSRTKNTNTDFKVFKDMYKTGGEFDIGNFDLFGLINSDNDDKDEAIKYLLDAIDPDTKERMNYSFNAIDAGLRRAIDRGIINDTIPKVGTTKFGEVEEFIKSIHKAEKAGKAYGGSSRGFDPTPYINEKDLRYTHQEQKLPHELQRELLSMGLPTTTSKYLDVGDLELGGVLPSRRNGKQVRRIVSEDSEDSESPTETTPTVVDETPAPQATTFTRDEILGTLIPKTEVTTPEVTTTASVADNLRKFDAMTEKEQLDHLRRRNSENWQGFKQAISRIHPDNVIRTLTSRHNSFDASSIVPAGSKAARVSKLQDRGLPLPIARKLAFGKPLTSEEQAKADSVVQEYLRELQVLDEIPSD